MLSFRYFFLIIGCGINKSGSAQESDAVQAEQSFGLISMFDRVPFVGRVRRVFYPRARRIPRMGYAELSRRLDESGGGEDAASVLAFPDGSVDAYYRVTAAGEDAFRSREAFGRAIASSRNSFPLERERTLPGGQAVNMARQAAALGDDVRLLGHLDDPTFDGLEFDATSMGDPGRVSILGFDDDDVMLAEDSRDVREWGREEFEAALPGGVGSVADYDAVCCGNWVSMPGQADVLGAVADAASEGGTFALDPGSVSGTSAARRSGLLDAVARLGGAFETVLSVNESELASLADHVGAEASETDARLDAVRRACDASAVAVHGSDAAAVATSAGRARVEMLSVPRVATVTGAGDRFTAGLARARGAGWDWESALALGNACAAYRVGSGQTADRSDLREFVASRR